MASGLITEYLGEGLAASRPATPDIGAGALAYWYSTDTNELSVYADGAWIEDIISGATLALDDLTDVDTTGVSDGDVLTFDSGSGDWIAAAPTGGGGGSAPAVRSSRITAHASAASFTFTLPAGSAAGDLCVIIHGGGFGPAGITAPSSAVWQTTTYSASNWGGTIFKRILTATDISAGTVTITPNPGGSFNAVTIGVTFVGAGDIRLPLFALAPGSGSASSALETDGAPLTTDYVLAFATNRAASNNTSTFGAALQTVNAANGSGAVYGGNPGSLGGVSSTFAYSTAGTGRFEGFVIIKALT